MRRLLLLVLAWSTGMLLPAQSPLQTIILAPAPAANGSRELTIELLVLNPSSEAHPIHPPAELNATFATARGPQPVLMRARSSAAVSVPAGSFVRLPYLLTPPPDARGEAVLAVTFAPDSVQRTVVSLPSPVEAAFADTAETEPAHLPTPAERVAAQRAFAGRFAAHEPIYFMYGPDTPGAKFQFSFKYRLLSAGNLLRHPDSRLNFAYTQRSLWDIDAASSPFYDSSYMPALFYEKFARPEKIDGGLEWLGFQSGFQHESNGRDGADSRSLNTLFLRVGLVAGRLDGWHLTAFLRAQGYVGGLSDNNNLDDYRGYGDWLFTVAHGDGARLSYSGRAGKDFDHFTTQLDLSIPVQFRLLDFATFFLVQYFNGYGESLRSYEVRSETIRAGFSFVR